MSDIVSKNLLKYPYFGTSSDYEGIEFTDNNGAITINGSPTRAAYYNCRTQEPIYLKKGKYIVSVSIPLGEGIYFQVIYNDGSGEKSLASITRDKTSQEFTLTDEFISNAQYWVIRIAVLANIQVDNLVIKPMIRLASDTDDTWEPYHPPIHVPDVYFRCTSTAGGAKLEVSYGDEFVGKVLAATNGNKTIRRMAGTSGTVTFTVPESGLWTVSGEVDGTTYSVQESVVLDYSVALVSGFDYKSWLTAGGVDPTSYSSLADVLADEILVRRLMTIHAAVDYLASFQTVNAGLETVINDDICAKWINDRDYALDTLHANSAIAAVMDTADKYFYGEWVLKEGAGVPTMSGNTSPSGECIASSYESSNPNYLAFDGQANTFWSSNNNSTLPQYIGYKFPSKVCVRKYSIMNSAHYRVQSVILIASNDGTNWTEIGESHSFSDSSQVDHVYEVDNNEKYQYYAVKILTTLNSANPIVSKVQFYTYEWAPKGCVPVMTGNSVPYGEASASSANSGYEAYKAFDNNPSTQWLTGGSNMYIQYKFTNPICIKRAYVKSTTGSSRNIAFKVSNDGSTWSDLGETITVAANAEHTEDFSQDNYWLYVRMTVAESASTAFSGIQFYGRQLSVSVPVMTGNTAPFGECFSQYSGMYEGSLESYKVFDNSDSTEFTGAASTSTQRYCYDFINKVKVCMAKHKASTSYGGTVKTIRLQYSDNKTDWYDGGAAVSFGTTEGATTFVFGTEPEAHRYWCVYLQSDGVSSWNTKTVQLWGLDYSEKEFEAGTTKKWLYDHGVELETFTVRKGSTTTSGSPTYDRGELYFPALVGTAASRSNYSLYEISLNLTNYDLLRAKIGSRAIGVGTPSKAIGLYILPSSASSGTYSEPDADCEPPIPYESPNSVLSIDISSFNQSKYIEMGVLYNNGKVGSLTELWVE